MTKNPVNQEQKILKSFFHPLARNKEALELKNDAAYLFKRKKMVVSSDMMIEGKHFDKNYDPKVLARKLLRVNLSDIAAMGAMPYGYILNIAIPKKNHNVWLKRFTSGLRLDGNKFGLKLFGGDLSESSQIFLSATIFGFVKKKIHKEIFVSEGSEIYVGGNIGDAALGFELLKDRKEKKINSKNFFLKKLYLPDPQITLGISILGIAEFCTDISDGLISELELISENSNLKANIFLKDIPLSKNTKKEIIETNDKKKKWEVILTGGEDYKLLFSVKQNKLNLLKKKKLQNIKKIGYFSQGIGVDIYDLDKKKINFKKKGFCHF